MGSCPLRFLATPLPPRRWWCSVAHATWANRRSRGCFSTARSARVRPASDSSRAILANLSSRLPASWCVLGGSNPFVRAGSPPFAVCAPSHLRAPSARLPVAALCERAVPRPTAHAPADAVRVPLRWRCLARRAASAVRRLRGCPCLRTPRHRGLTTSRRQYMRLGERPWRHATCRHRRCRLAHSHRVSRGSALFRATAAAAACRGARRCCGRADHSAAWASAGLISLWDGRRQFT